MTKTYKTITFLCRGAWHVVSVEPKTMGHVMKAGSGSFKLPHASWKILGVTKRWNSNTLDYNIKQLGKNPKLMVKGYVWDVDHGTQRTWGGVGEVRVMSAYKSNHTWKNGEWESD